MPIALPGAPVQAMIRVGAHYDALYREFRPIVERDPSKQEAIPGRLLQRIHEFGTEFLGFGAAAEEAWGHAVRRGDDTVDLTFRLQPKLRLSSNTTNVS